MGNQSGVYAKFDSPLFGASVQVVEVAASVLNAEVAACRLFNLPRHVPCVYVSPGGLRSRADACELIAAWPETEQSLFAALRRPNVPRDRVFRPDEALDGPAYASIRSVCPVSDALCVPMKLEAEVWGLAAFLRRSPDDGFTQAQHDALERYRPAMTRLIRRGYQRELAQTRSTAAQVIADGHPLSLHELIEQLSHTERAVLTYLRTQLTERRIAEEMDRSRHTIHVHVKSIYRKLGVRSRRQLDQLLAHAQN